MNISSANNFIITTPSASNSAVEGIRSEEQRFERNVAEVARAEDPRSQHSGTRDKALVEQHEIVQSVRANARSLEAASERIGTLIDLQA